MDFLVTPPEQTDWRIDPQEFVALLRGRWPDADVRENASDPTYAYDFSLAVDGQDVDGAFARDGQMLGLLHDVWACAVVAAWLREQVPAEQPLLFYDPAYNGHVELTPGLSPRELAERYLASQG